MKKKLTIPLCIVCGLLLAVGITALIFRTNGYGITVGRFIWEGGNKYELLDGETCISLSGDFDTFVNVSTGDKVLVLHGPMAESYPVQTHAYMCIKLAEGSWADVTRGEALEYLDGDTAETETEVTEQSESEVPTVSAETVSYTYKYASITLDLPDRWDYELTEYTENCSCFGFTLYPQYKTDCTLTVMYYPGMFGVCGTGLREAVTILDGKAANAGYYDSSDIWNFITVDDYAVVNNMPDATFEMYGEDIDAILDSVKLGEGIIDQDEAIDIALSVSSDKDESLAVGKFDYERGIWTVRFYTDDSFSSYSWCVDVDYEGTVVNMYIAEPAA